MKKLIAMLLLASLILTFAACSGSKDGDDTSTKGTTTTKVTTRDPGPGPDDPDNPDDPGDEEGYDPNLYLIYGSAVIDGVKDEKWNSAEAAPILLTTNGAMDPNTTATAYAMWDEEGLYFLFEISAPAFSQTSTAGDYRNSGIYLFVSETLDFTADDGGGNSYSNGNYQFALINEELSMIPRRGESDLVAEDGDYEVVYNLEEDKGSFIIEFHYKPKHVELKEGLQMLLDFQYNDCANGTRLGAARWYDSADGDFKMINFGIGELLSKDATSIPEHI